MATKYNGVTQGTLNRVLSQLTISDYPSLNVTSQNMGKSMITVAFNEAPVLQIGTGTGIVSSPEPYIMVTFTVNLLRTQSLSKAWLEQVQSTGVLGTVIGYSDSSTFDSVSLDDASVTGIDSGAWDGTDPVIRFQITGAYYVNSNMWS